MDYEARERFAECVKMLRADRKHKQFAEILGVSRPTVIGWEHCKVAPKRESLERVAKLRGESLDEFLSYLEGARRRDPLDRLLAQLSGLSPEQMAVVLRAIADRFDQT